MDVPRRSRAVDAAATRKTVARAAADADGTADPTYTAILARSRGPGGCDPRGDSSRTHQRTGAPDLGAGRCDVAVRATGRDRAAASGNAPIPASVPAPFLRGRGAHDWHALPADDGDCFAACVDWRNGRLRRNAERVCQGARGVVARDPQDARRDIWPRS